MRVVSVSLSQRKIPRFKDLTCRPDGTEELRYQHADHLGSVVAETGDTGALRWREAYKP